MPGSLRLPMGRSREPAWRAPVHAVVAACRCELLVKSLVNLTGFDEAALRALMAHAGAQVPQPAALAVPSVPAQAPAPTPRPGLERAGTRGFERRDRRRGADLYPSLSLTGSITVSASTSLRRSPRGPWVRRCRFRSSTPASAARQWTARKRATGRRWPTTGKVCATP